MRIKAKFSSRCRDCGDAIMAGDTIEWARGAGAQCVVCADEDMIVNAEQQVGREISDLDEPAICDECGTAHHGSSCRRCDSEYAAGVADANRYLENRRFFGEEMAERMEIEQEMRGLDW